MSTQELSNQFDVLYNNITSNQAPGLNEYEKSVFLTKAEIEKVKNNFTANSKGNDLALGYDDSAKRQADFSCLMKTSICTGTKYTFILPSDEEKGLNEVTFTNAETLEEVDLIAGTYICLYMGNALQTVIGSDRIIISGAGVPAVNCTLKVLPSITKIDPRSGVYSFPQDVFILINETIKTTANKLLQVAPLRYDEYTRLMMKPFKRPLKNQAWRLINNGTGDGITASKYAEIITNIGDVVSSYIVRYIRVPKPIILSPLDSDLSISGYRGTDDGGNLVPATDTTTEVVGGIECELDPMLHEEILQRAVELAKIAWTANGQDNVQMVMAAGQRSE